MKNFQRISELIKKTKDRFIFEDDAGELCVVLSVNDYEQIMLKNNQVSHLSEEELLNKINKDVALWREFQADKNFENEWQELKDEKKEKLEEDQYYFEPAEDAD